MKIVTQRQRGRPKGRSKIRVGTLLPRDLYAEVQEYSQNHLININAIIELALRNFLHPQKQMMRIKKTPYQNFAGQIKANLTKTPTLRLSKEKLIEMLAFYKVQPRLDTLQRYLSKLAAEENLHITNEMGTYTIRPSQKEKEERKAEKRKQEDEEIKKILDAEPEA